MQLLHGYYEPILEGKRKVNPPLECMPDSLERIDDVLFASEPGPAAFVHTF